MKASDSMAETAVPRYAWHHKTNIASMGKIATSAVCLLLKQSQKGSTLSVTKGLTVKSHLSGLCHVIWVRVPELAGTQPLAEVQHHRGAPVRHAKLVRVHRRTATPFIKKSKGGRCPQLAGKGQDKAPQAGIHAEQ